MTSPPRDALDPDSPIARFIAVAPQLDPAGDLRAQVDSIESTYQAENYSTLTNLTTSLPEESARVLRTAVYAQLGLDEPHTPAEPEAVPLPEIDASSPPSHRVEGPSLTW
jgi:hypothetical protein